MSRSEHPSVVLVEPIQPTTMAQSTSKTAIDGPRRVILWKPTGQMRLKRDNLHLSESMRKSWGKSISRKRKCRRKNAYLQCLKLVARQKKSWVHSGSGSLPSE